jgi:hypothetical protein
LQALKSLEAFSARGRISNIELNIRSVIDPSIDDNRSGHSTRVGATQDLAALDIDLAAITQAGGKHPHWNSNSG